MLLVFLISLSTTFILQLFKIHLSLRGACEWRVCGIFVGAAISICQSSTITAVTEEINVASVLFSLIATTGWWVSPHYGWIQASSIFLFTSCFFLKAPGTTLSELQYLFLIYEQIMWMHLNIAEPFCTFHSHSLNIFDTQFWCFWSPKRLCKYCDDIANSMIK